MSNSINNQNDATRGLKVDVGLSVQRQTPKTDFGSIVGKGLNTAANIALQGTQIASAFIPGGQVVSAAVSGLSQMKNSMLSQAGNAGAAYNGGPISSSGTTTGGGGLVSGGTGMSGMGGGSFDATAGGGGAGIDPNITAQRQMMEMNQNFNMQYLGLQQDMQNENRKFTVLSNVMKTRHDTAKNAISNVR